MSNNFKDSIKNNISDPKIDKVQSDNVSAEDSNTFLLKKKVDDKKGKKAFNVYMEPDILKELDRVSKKSGWSRNELVNKMIQYCLTNVEIVEE